VNIMKKEIILQSIRLSLAFLVLLGIFYPAYLWLFSLCAPERADGSPVIRNNSIIGYENIGQLFTKDEYFSGRPSAVGYGSGKSGGSNFGFSNPQYLESVEKRIKDILLKNPDIHISAIPIDLITASGSGLDPHISIEAALVQVARISRVRNIKPDSIVNIVNKVKEEPFLGVFGPIKVNVLKLNLTLDNLK